MARPAGFCSFERADCALHRRHGSPFGRAAEGRRYGRARIEIQPLPRFFSPIRVASRAETRRWCAARWGLGVVWRRKGPFGARRRGRPAVRSAAAQGQAVVPAAFTCSTRMPGRSETRAASEPAIRCQPEFRQVFAGQCDALLESRHVVDCAEIDAGAVRVEILKRREEGLILGVQQGDVDPVHASARSGQESVGEDSTVSLSVSG